MSQYLGQSEASREEVHERAGLVRAGLCRLVLGDRGLQDLFRRSQHTGTRHCSARTGMPQMAAICRRYPVLAAHPLPSGCRRLEYPLERALSEPGSEGDLLIITYHP